MSEQAKILALQLVRNVFDMPHKHFVRAPLYESQRGKVTAGMAAKKLGVSFDRLPPGKRVCPYHLHHAQEELFVVLRGTGTLRVAGEMLAIKAGDVITIPAGPEYPHQIINTSQEQLEYLSISTMEEPEICEYPDSGKFMAEGSMDREAPFEVISRRGKSADYWDGEP
jgi:uncharacterized cupin superfamily protein